MRVETDDGLTIRSNVKGFELCFHPVDFLITPQTYNQKITLPNFLQKKNPPRFTERDLIIKTDKNKIMGTIILTTINISILEKS